MDFLAFDTEFFVQKLFGWVLNVPFAKTYFKVVVRSSVKEGL